MDAVTQSLVVGIIVLAAAAYVARRVWSTIASARRDKARGRCGDGCCK